LDAFVAAYFFVQVKNSVLDSRYCRLHRDSRILRINYVSLSLVDLYCHQAGLILVLLLSIKKKNTILMLAAMNISLHIILCVLNCRIW
jgi:hypothetical protein